LKSLFNTDNCEEGERLLQKLESTREKKILPQHTAQNEGEKKKVSLPKIINCSGTFGRYLHQGHGLVPINESNQAFTKESLIDLTVA
jgi:hypothetical protein